MTNGPGAEMGLDLPGAIVDLVQDTSKYKLGVQIAGEFPVLLDDER